MASHPKNLISESLIQVVTLSTLLFLSDVFLSTIIFLLDLCDTPHTIPVLRFIWLFGYSNTHPMIPFITPITTDHWQVVILLSACWTDPDLLSIIIYVMAHGLCNCNSSSSTSFAATWVVSNFFWSGGMFSPTGRGDINSSVRHRYCSWRWICFHCFASLCCWSLRSWGGGIFASTIV